MNFFGTGGFGACFVGGCLIVAILYSPAVLAVLLFFLVGWAAIVMGGRRMNP